VAYIKIKYKNQEIELTPEAIKEVIKQAKRQIKDMSFKEVVDTANALGQPLVKLISILKG